MLPRTLRKSALVGFSAALLAGCSLTASQPIPPLNPILIATEEPPAPPTQTPQPQPSPEPEPEPAEQDPMLRDLLASLIPGDVPNINIYSTNRLPTSCPADVDGCFTPNDDTIYVSSEMVDFRLPEILAHEYLHYVWYRDRLDLDSELEASLKEAYTDPQGLKAAIPTWIDAYYEGGTDPAPTELFSYACTILRPDQLSAVIAEECSTYLRLEQLPVNQSMSIPDLYEQVNALRAEAGQPSLPVNVHAERASQAYADAFTPTYQPSPDNYPDSALQHLNAGCAPAQYVYSLTRPHDLDPLWHELDEILAGKLLGGSTRGIGIGTKSFDFIDASDLFDNEVIQVNATILVATICE